jgi:hypothetical protein
MPAKRPARQPLMGAGVARARAGTPTRTGTDQGKSEEMATTQLSAELSSELAADEERACPGTSRGERRP